MIERNENPVKTKFTTGTSNLEQLLSAMNNGTRFDIFLKCPFFEFSYIVNPIEQVFFRCSKFLFDLFYYYYKPEQILKTRKFTKNLNNEQVWSILRFRCCIVKAQKKFGKFNAAYMANLI